MDYSKQFQQAGKYACILFDKTFKVTVCKQENEELLRGIIELLIPGKRISHLKLDRNENSGDTVSDKTTIFDMICTDADTGQRFVVEMQFADQHSYKDRMISYATYPIREQLAEKIAAKKKKEPLDRMDYTLNPVYVISLVNFSLEHSSAEALDDNGLISRYSVRNDGNNELMTDALHFIYLELERLRYEESEWGKCRSVLEQFAFSLKYIHTLNERPESFTDPTIAELFKATELASMSTTEREKYEYEMRTQLDIIAERQFACDKAKAEGKVEVAKNLLSLDVSPDIIAKATGLSAQEIASLK